MCFSGQDGKRHTPAPPSGKGGVSGGTACPARTGSPSPQGSLLLAPPAPDYLSSSALSVMCVALLMLRAVAGSDRMEITS